MKKSSYLILSWLVLLVFLYGCSISNTTYRELSDIADKRLGFLNGSISEELLHNSYPQASVKSYDKAISLFMDIEFGKCDVAVLNQKTALMVMSRNSDYACLDTWEAPNQEVWYIILPKSQISKKAWKKAEEKHWLQNWYDDIHRNFINANAWKLILGGLYTTVVICFFGSILAIALAIFITYMHINHRWQWLYHPLHWFVFTIHDVPSVVLMMFFYYVVFASVGMVNGILVSIIALGIYSSGSLTKIFTIHIEQVGKEQRDVAQMLGFTPWKTYQYIILPQAVKSMLPLVIGELKLLLRATSYAGYIAQKDLVKTVDSIRSQTLDAFLPLIFISLLYLALSWLIVRSVSLLSTKLFHHD